MDFETIFVEMYCWRLLDSDKYMKHIGSEKVARNYNNINHILENLYASTQLKVWHVMSWQKNNNQTCRPGMCNPGRLHDLVPGRSHDQSSRLFKIENKNIIKKIKKKHVAIKVVCFT